MNAMLPAHLSETLNSLGDAARALAEEVRDDRAHRETEMRAAVAAQRRQNRIMVTLLAIVAVLVIGLVTIGVQNRLRSNQNAQIIRQTAATSEQIADCTTVGGKCYEQGGRRTTDAVRMIILAQVYTPTCSKITETDDALVQCVMRKLAAAASAAPTPAPATQPPVPGPSPSGD